MNRLNELRQMLQDAPYDAVLLTGEINRRYATGFHSTAGGGLSLTAVIGRVKIHRRNTTQRKRRALQ